MSKYQKPDLHVLVGVPSSGKSTLAEKLSKQIPNSVVHSSDAIRDELTGIQGKQCDPTEVFQILYERTKESLERGQTVIYDATNVKKADRRLLIEEMRPYCSQLEAHFLNTSLKLCKMTNKHRKHQGMRSVREEVIDRMFETLEKPSQTEGFDKVNYVKW